MGKKLVDLTIDEVSLVKKGYKPVHQDAVIEFFKAMPEPEVTQSNEGGFFSKIRKAFEKITKGVVADKVNAGRPQRELNQALWAMSDALDEVRWGYGSAYGLNDDQKKQAMCDIINEGTKLMIDAINEDQTDVSKAMDTKSGADYEQKDISKNSPGKKKKNKDDPDGDGDVDNSDPALDTDDDKGKGKVKKSMDEFKKAIEDAMASVPETIKKAVEDATKPHQEAIEKAQADFTASVEKATADISALVGTAKTDIAKAVDDAKIELGRVTKAAPDAGTETKVIKADTSFGDAIRTLMNS